jgi:predicted nuclease of predicted toxin-antitoxin system
MENVGVTLLLDEHFSRRIVTDLHHAFPGMSHVVLAGLQSRDGDQLRQFAASNGWTIVTKDEDSRLLSLTRGHPPKVIWVRSGNGPTDQVRDLPLRARAIIEAFSADPDHSLLVLP